MSQADFKCEKCRHAFTLDLNGTEIVVCKKCGEAFTFENRRPRHIDAPRYGEPTVAEKRYGGTE